MEHSASKEPTKKQTVLILIEDGSYLFDNRVRREATTLAGAGYKVLVICPRYPGETAFDDCDGVLVHRYKKFEFGGHYGEYLSSLIKGGALSLYLWFKHRFHCIQACNPPDIWFIPAAFYKIFGVKFIFDHHDLCPELYLSRFGATTGSLGYKTMLFLEKLTFKLADGVISTNESYKKIAMTRGGQPEGNVNVVRNGPDLNKFKPSPPDPKLKPPDRINVGYLGNMNPQDGVEHLLLAAKNIVQDLGRKEFHFFFIGKGDSFSDLTAKRSAWGLEDNVTFTGRLPDDDMLRHLSSCDICVQPDPKNPLNDFSTMNKVMEYMALAKPVVAYDLVETRFSCGDCALYAKPNEAEDLAAQIMRLADDEALRLGMGKNGRDRVESMLAWPYSEPHLLEIYGKVLKRAP